MILLEKSKLMILMWCLLNLDAAVQDWFEALGYLITIVALTVVVLRGTR